MSLAALLSSKSVDDGLDDIFKSSAGPSTITTIDATEKLSTRRKRKLEDALEDRSSRKTWVSQDNIKRSRQKENGTKREETKPDDKEDLPSSVASSDEDDSESAIPEHESVKKSNKGGKGRKKAKYIPESESREQRDARTIFIGNLPAAVVKSKPLSKQLKRHILSHVPLAKIESIRFRSVAFSNPTTKLEEEWDETPVKKQKRQQKRAADWREQNQAADSMSKREKDEAEEDKKGEKTYMTPAEKRRLAAIHGDVHGHSAAATNAYVVFAYPIPFPPDTSTSHIPRKEVIDPFEATREAIKKVDGTIFADHMLRVDLVGKKTGPGQDMNRIVSSMTDPKHSIFVGNLDFTSSEDDVRAFFEKLMCEERGQPASETQAGGGDANNAEEGNSRNEDMAGGLRKTKWVARVRIVRDRETQLGKGFAYVQFSDRDCVDEVLALEAERLKFAKRTLRVQRCKMQPALAAKLKSQQQSPAKVHSVAVTNPRTRSSEIPIPKGDPTLGARLAGLPKEARKHAKATEPMRLARRLAKKKARLALEQAENKAKRVRVRKEKKGTDALNSGRKSGKKRERSERNVERKNMKK